MPVMSATNERPTITYGITHFPKAMIIDNERYSGTSVEIVQLLAEKLGFDVRYYPCPRARCLLDMKAGSVDILSGVFKREDRESYIHYLDPPLTIETALVFYMQRSQTLKIRKYSDLRTLTIGKIIGMKYFEPFDTDRQLNKIEVSTSYQLFRMLLSGRIDTLLGLEVIHDIEMEKNRYENLIDKSPYRIDKDMNLYFALSKKSPIIDKKESFRKALSELFRSGQVEGIIKKYYGDSLRVR